MAAHEYLICLDCESPCYEFEYKDGKIVEILCEVCGNDQTDQFATSEEADALGL